MRKYFSFMYELTKGHRLKYLCILIILLITTILTLLSSYVTKIVVDCFSYTNEVADIFVPNKSGPIGTLLIAILGGPEFINNNKWILVIAIMLFGFFLATSNIVKGLLRASIESKISAGLRNKLFDHIQRLPYEFLKKQNKGDLLQTCTRDESVLREFVVRQFTGLCYTIDMLVFSFIILLSVDYRIALCSVAILPILFIYSFIFIKQVRVKYRETDEAEAVVTGKIEETINSVRVIKAYNNERLEIKKFDEDLNRYGHKYIKWRRLSALYHGTSDIFIFLTIVASSLLSAILCFNKDISLGTMVITSTYTTMVVWPIRDCATTLADLARAFVSIDRMNNILNTKTEDIDEGLTPEIKGNIEFKDITFRYEDSTKDCLKDINLSIKSKQTIAIMGKTGSGKSTLALLLTRLFDYQSGSIKIDGVELKDISKRHIRQNVATVLQEPFLFSRSVYDNLTIAHQDINKEEVIKATKIAHVDEAINKFKDGYSSEIGEKGTTISGGQKQRITIARTILTKAPIVIFDDSLSAVDAETDNKIRSALKHHNDATTIIITHRINTTKDADMIVVLDNGMISEIGTHDDLIAKNGFYNHIYELQERNE